MVNTRVVAASVPFSSVCY